MSRSSAGGYVGVDVFFVISGFLITALLVREAASAPAGSRSRRFYARRALRLLPASTVLVAATLVGGLAVVVAAAARRVRPGRRCRRGLRDATYGWPLVGTDYLAAGRPPSPLQHLLVARRGGAVLPALAAADPRGDLGRPVRAPARGDAGRAERRFADPEHHRDAALRAVGVLRGAHPDLGTRARRPARPGRGPAGTARPRVAATMGWAGLAAIAAAALAYDDRTAYPGVAAMLPVAGAALVLAAGCADPARGARMLLAPAPCRSSGGCRTAGTCGTGRC